MKSKSGKVLDLGAVPDEGDDRTPPTTISDSIRQNHKLIEEVRQLRVALAIWAEVAVRTCLNCEYRRQAKEIMTPLLGKAMPTDLVGLSETLRAKIAETPGSDYWAGRE